MGPRRPMRLRVGIAGLRARVQHRLALSLLLDAALVFLGTWLGAWLVIRFLVADPDPSVPAVVWALLMTLAHVGVRLMVERDEPEPPRPRRSEEHRPIDRG